MIKGAAGNYPAALGLFMNNIYLTPAERASSEVTEKRSKFIGDIAHVKDEAEAIDFIKNIKKKYFDAKHCAYAYITGTTKRYSDDGEPSKTAGMPILEILEANGLADCVCTVTRYFGGILLGTGGLVRAYGLSAKLALENAGIKKLTLSDIFSVSIPYNAFDRFKYIADQSSCSIIDSNYAESISLTCACTCETYESFVKKIDDVFGPSVTIVKTDTVYM